MSCNVLAIPSRFTVRTRKTNIKSEPDCHHPRHQQAMLECFLHDSGRTSSSHALSPFAQLLLMICDVAFSASESSIGLPRRTAENIRREGRRAIYDLG